jgi:hypothetical protein
MQALWNNLATRWPLSAPAPTFKSWLGDAFGQVQSLRLLRRTPIRDGDLYPSACDQDRIVTKSIQGLVATCTCVPPNCLDATSDPPELHALDDRALIALLRAALGLNGPAEGPHRHRPTALGARSFGTTTVQFRLSLATPSESTHRNIVTLVPTADQLPTDPTPNCLALADLVDLQTGVADLADLVLNDIAPHNLELLWPRYALTVEGQRFHYAGQRLPLDRHPRLAALLTALAKSPSRWLNRQDLVLALYPDAITTRGRLLEDPIKLDRRIRQVVSDLGKAFATVDPHDLAANPIENLRARSDAEGGYRLALPPDRIFIHQGAHHV